MRTLVLFTFRMTTVHSVDKTTEFWQGVQYRSVNHISQIDSAVFSGVSITSEYDTFLIWLCSLCCVNVPSGGKLSGLRDVFFLVELCQAHREK